MASILESNTWTTSSTYGIFLHINSMKTLVHRGCHQLPKPPHLCPIITRQGVSSMANTQSVHHINHMIHALPFGITCSETMSVHARLVKATLVSACVKLSCTRCMYLLILSHPIITRCFEPTRLGNGATKDEHFIILRF